MNDRAKTNNLLRQQLDNRFKNIPRHLLQAPKEGWIKTLRRSLGMTGVQLARRLKISKPSMAELESSEKNSTITMTTLKKVAEALDCDVFVTLIPRRSLQAILESRAAEVAKEMAQKNLHHMELEAQGTSEQFLNDQIRLLSGELVGSLNRRLWEEP